MWDRFDRQIRIWGLQGQRSLERASVCLVAKSFHDVLLQEIMKSLTLSGIGGITLLLQDVDSANESYGSNGGFFLSSGELLDDKNTTTRILSWKHLSDPACVYNIIAAVNLQGGRELGWLLSQAREPVVVTVVDKGTGSVDLCLKEDHFVIDSRPEYSVPEVRICNAWPELKEFYESFDLDQWSNSGRLEEVPYPVILYHVVKEVESKDLAGLSSERLKCKIEERFPNNLDDLNVKQAKRFAHLAQRNLAEVPRMQAFIAGLGRALEKDEWFDPLDGEIAYFLKCLDLFLKNNDSLPLSGVLPDMESSSELYSRLAALYRAKHNEDVQRFSDIMAEVAGKPSSYQGAEEIFIKKLNCISHLPANCHQGFSEIISPRARVLSDTSIPQELRKQRDTAVTIQTSCLVGGVASQELIKIITHQYFPITDTFTYKSL